MGHDWIHVKLHVPFFFFLDAFTCETSWALELRAHKTALKLSSIMSNSFLKKAHQSLIIFQ